MRKALAFQRFRNHRGDPSPGCKAQQTQQEVAPENSSRFVAIRHLLRFRNQSETFDSRQHLHRQHRKTLTDVTFKQSFPPELKPSLAPSNAGQPSYPPEFWQKIENSTCFDVSSAPIRRQPVILSGFLGADEHSDPPTQIDFAYRRAEKRRCRRPSMSANTPATGDLVAYSGKAQIRLHIKV
jgi:hypothetical protein